MRRKLAEHRRRYPTAPLPACSLYRARRGNIGVSSTSKVMNRTKRDQSEEGKKWFIFSSRSLLRQIMHCTGVGRVQSAAFLQFFCIMPSRGTSNALKWLLQACEWLFPAHHSSKQQDCSVTAMPCVGTRGHGKPLTAQMARDCLC